MLDLPPRISDSLLELLHSQRLVAHMVIDDSQELLQAGGHLDHYGLAELRPGGLASDQLPFLEGLLPLAETPFLIRSMEMPSGRVADIHFFDDEGTVWILLLDMTAEYEETRKVQQKAYDMTLLSQREARLIEQLEAANQELTRAHGELAASREALLLSHERLERELRDAERYVLSMLPPPLTEPLAVDWRFVPSTELGGDSFGYHWIDDEHFALYLIDVCGHGVGSALLSVAVVDTLRSGALPRIDLRNPAQVLTALNLAYPMQSHGELFCTVWYGVYQRTTGRLRYASAGHPPAVLVRGTADAAGEAVELQAAGPCIGLSDMASYRDEQCELQSPARLFVFSDGAYEIARPDGSMLAYADFTSMLARSELDGVLDYARQAHGPGALEDDFTIIRMTL